MSQVQVTAMSVEAESLELPAIWRYRGLALLMVDVAVVLISFLVVFYLRFHLQFLALTYFERNYSYRS